MSSNSPSRNKKPLLQTVLHISSSRITVAIGRYVAADDIQVIGYARTKDSGFYAGTITDRSRLIAAIKYCIQQAEDKANCVVSKVILLIDSHYYDAINAQADIDLVARHRSLHQNDKIDQFHSGVEVSVDDMVYALSSVKANHVSQDKYVFFHNQQGVLLDETSKDFREALGLYAHRLQVLFHLGTLPVNELRNYESVLRACNQQSECILPGIVARAEFCLTTEEKKLGVCLIDIGASTTSYCIYVDNKLVVSKSLAQGGDHITWRLVDTFDIDVDEAEKLKRTHATLDRRKIEQSCLITLNRNNNKETYTISEFELCEVVKQGYQEILNHIAAHLNEEGLFDFIKRGFVLSGGGCHIDDLDHYVKANTNMPVRYAVFNPIISAELPESSTNMDKAQHASKLAVNLEILKHYEYEVVLGGLIYFQSEQHLKDQNNEAINQQDSLVMKLKVYSKVVRDKFYNFF